MKTILVFAAGALLALGAAAAPLPGKSLTIRSGSAGGVDVTFCQHDAYAICSMKWNGKEFIDDYDHGRQLQTALSFDNRGEDYNPTEAGASYLTDGVNPSPSSSVNSRAVVENGRTFRATTRMAYWNPVGKTKLSNWVLDKRVTAVNGRHAQYLDVGVTVRGIAGEPTHRNGVFEFLTGYVPSEFSDYFTYDVKGSRELTAIHSCLDRDKRCSPEQPLPLIFATPDGRHAIGIYSRNLPQSTFPNVGYGRFSFPGNKVRKWNSVYRFSDIEPRTRYPYHGYVIVGALENVQRQMQALYDAGK